MKTLYQQKVIPIPEGCKVTLTDKVFTFQGPLGKQDYDVSKFRFTFEVAENNIVVHSWHGNKRKKRSAWNSAAHIKNHANGVVTGFKHVLKAVFRHFSISMNIGDKGKNVTVRNFWVQRFLEISRCADQV